MGEILVSIANLTKRYQGYNFSELALGGVNIDVCRGEFLAINGPSGCGKSTLLSIVGLLDSQSSGSYELCGKNVCTLSDYQKSILRNRHIGWVFQRFNLIEKMTVFENVELPLKYSSLIEGGRRRGLVMEAIDSVGMSGHEIKYPAQLSGGQQQRIAIARALVTKPDLLIADEPTGNLDGDNSRRVFDLLSEINRFGVTIIMVTHDSELANRCERIVSMNKGLISSSAQSVVTGVACV